MSIWSDNIDELEENMESIVRQRIQSGEFTVFFGDNVVDVLTEPELDNARDICNLLERRLGRLYCHNVMEEALQEFIDKQIDSAELSCNLALEAEADAKETSYG